MEYLDEKPEGSIALVAGPVEIYLPLAEMVDPEEEKLRLGKDLQETEAQINRLQQLLDGPFAEKAPEKVIQGEREKLAGYLESADKIRAQLESLQ